MLHCSSGCSVVSCLRCSSSNRQVSTCQTLSRNTKKDERDVAIIVGFAGGGGGGGWKVALFCSIFPFHFGSGLAKNIRILPDPGSVALKTKATSSFNIFRQTTLISCTFCITHWFETIFCFHSSYTRKKFSFSSLPCSA
jgi:hypothetical protein